jgi:hypothetical protein
MRKKIQKLPKWIKIVLWISGTITIFIAVLYALASIWVSTWKTYRNEEFGFSFRYPAVWHISGNPIDKQYFDSDRGLFWIDSKEELPLNEQDVFRSPGNVQIRAYKQPTTYIEEQKEQRSYSTYTTKKFGEKFGYVYDITSITSDGVQLFTKDAFVETDDYVYAIGTQTYAESTSFLSKIKTRYYHWIGSAILDSFKFD